jgi:hypothetical protein
VHAVQRPAVVHAAAGGLGHAVARDHGDALGPRPGPEAGVRGGTADQHRVEGQQRARFGVEVPAQLGGHHRHVPPAGGHPREGGGQRLAAGEHGRRRAGQDRAAQHLQPRDRRHRQGEQPRPGAAEALLGRRGRGAHGRGRQQHAGAGAGRAGGDDDEVRAGLQGLLGPQQRAGRLDRRGRPRREDRQRSAAVECGAQVGQQREGVGGRGHEGQVPGHEVPE